MPEIIHEPKGPDIPDEEAAEALPSRTGFFSTAYSSAALLPDPTVADADAIHAYVIDGAWRAYKAEHSKTAAKQ